MKNTGLAHNIQRKILQLLIGISPRAKAWNLNRLIKNKQIIHCSDIDEYLDTALKVIIPPIPGNIHVGLVKLHEAFHIENYFVLRAYWPRYERFMKNNNISYSFYDIHASDWQQEAEKYDIILWQSHSSPEIQEEAKTKVYFLEKYMNKICLPSYHELWSYENKIRDYYIFTHYGIPVVPTFISNSRANALKYIEQASFPIISKIATGSSSLGVHKINNKREAIKYIKSCFSVKGRKTYWPHIRQKNYVYFQKFIDDSKFDLRIIIVGNKIVGYFRYPYKGDFRASGTGIHVKKALPEEAMSIALDAYKKLNYIVVAIDMVFSEKEQKYYIIESSVSCGIYTPVQLVVDGKSGYYEYDGNNFTFNEGTYWTQDLVLEKFFNSPLIRERLDSLQEKKSDRDRDIK